MSTRVIDGAYTSLVSNIPKNVKARFGAIGIVGNFTSGIKLDAAGTATFGSGATAPTATEGNLYEGWETFAGGGTGIIYQFDSFDQVQKRFGKIHEISWVAPTINQDGADISAYDYYHSLMRGLELVYLGNPSVRTYVAVLDGSGTDGTASGAATHAGVVEALAELTKHDDISFVVGAGMDYNATFQAHANTASNDTNQAERMYIGGTSLQEVMATTSRVPDLDADEGQNDDWDALKQDTGRSVMFAGNANYIFQTGSGTVREIGGNYLAAYVAGLLSSLPEQQSLLRYPIGFIQKYKTENFRWSRTDQTELVTGRVLHMKTSGGISVFSRALTHAPTTTSFVRITTRRITDRLIKEVRATSDIFVGQSNTEVNRIGMRSSVDNKLTTLARLGLIQAGSSSNVWVEGTDVADGVVRVSALFKPITEIEFVEIQLTVEI